MGSDDHDIMKPGEPLSADAGSAGVHAAPIEVRAVRPILVLGMHRSGTSAIARVLRAMGVYLGEPDELLPAHPQDNPAGYWERIELVIEHDRFLGATGHAWDRIANFDSHHLSTAARDALGTRLRAIIDKFNAGGKTWLVKDPRLSLLLPQWLPLLHEPACIVAVRDPREIASSLLATHRGVYTSHFILALWEKYLRILLGDLRGRRVLFVSYDALVTHPRAQSQRLQRGLRSLGIESGLHALSEAELEALLEQRLRRSEMRAHMLLSPAQEQLFAWLDAQTRADGAVAVAGFPEHPMPDAVLEEFQRALFEAARSHLAVDEANAHLRKIETMLDEQARERSNWVAELSSHRQQAEQARGESTRLASSLHVTQRHRDDLQHSVTALELHKARLDNDVSGLSDTVKALRTSWSWKCTAPLRWVAGAFRPSGSFAIEQRLYRMFYSIPGVNAGRKRGLVLWLHQHAPWLTRHTFSYQLYARSRQAELSPGHVAKGPRMDATRAEAIISAMPALPRISILMPVYNVERRWLTSAVDSVRRQFYPHWELCLADDASTLAETRAALDELAAAGDARIKIVRLPANVGIAAATNAALQLASGDYVGLLDNDDTLTRDALLEVAREILAHDPDIVYSDEDKLDVDGRHVDAHFKSDFNLDYFLSINYLCHFMVLRRSVLDRIGGFRPGYDGAQDYDLLLRATESGERIRHIPKVLYHWRMTPGSTATASAAKPKSWDAGLRALGESLQRRGIDARAEPGPYPNSYRVRRAIAAQPLVSILVPFRDKPDLLSTCILSLLGNTRYQHFEVVGIDNGSTDPATHALMRQLEQRDARVRFVRFDQPFNYSSINNFGAANAQGEHLLLLNNDTEIVAPEWLEAMLEHSQRPEVGVVGAKLLYPDQRIQHAGVIVGIGGVAGHAHLLQPGDQPGYFSRAQLLQNLSAVTFACAMTRRAVWQELGGLNDRELSIAFNDIDYCLRAREAGYLVVYTPYATLYHHESRTRGYEDNVEKQARFFRETVYMQSRHRDLLQRGDPYYNPNLRLDTHDFSALPGYVDELPR
jgi:O-antigen biosynthesis protein